jgi:hypothetical protein
VNKIKYNNWGGKKKLICTQINESEWIEPKKEKILAFQKDEHQLLKNSSCYDNRF